MDMTEDVESLIKEISEATAEMTRLELCAEHARIRLGLLRARFEEVVREQDFRTLNENEKALCRSGNFITAIKALRDRSYQLRADGTRGPMLGLKEAKDIVDAYRATLPSPQEY